MGTILTQNLAAMQTTLDRQNAKLEALLDYMVECVIIMIQTIGLFMLTMEYSTSSESGDESATEDTKEGKRNREDEEDDEQGEASSA